MIRSAATAVFIALAIQIFTVGILAPRLPREVCRPGIQVEETFTLSAVPVLRLVNTDGAVRIQTNPTQRDIQVTARVRAYTTGGEALAMAEAYIPTLFDIKESPDMIVIVTEPGVRPDPVDLRVDYTLALPPGMDIAIDVANGNVWIAEGCNNISVEGNNSDIEVVRPSGAVSIKTINGRIRASECASDTTLETVNGSIQATLTGGALQASTITGGIVATLLAQSVEACDLTSLNGSITLVMSDQHAADINAATERGLVRTEMAMELERGIQRRRMIHGIIGTGDTMVAVNSMNGDIVIQRSAT